MVVSPKRFSPKTRILNALRAPLRAMPIERLLAALTRHRPAESWICRIPANNYQYAKPSLRSVVREGIAYELDIADLVDWAIYFGLHEEARDELIRLARPGHVVLDIGANIGGTALSLARAVGGAGMVYGFEPDPLNFERCSRNVALNPYRNIVLERLAVGDEEKELDLFRVSERNPGMNRILPGKLGTSGIRVQTILLDKYVCDHGIPRVDLIKIDVEGFELNVLKGAQEIIERFRPTLFVELSQAALAESGASPEELLRWLGKFGYRFKRADIGSQVTAASDFKNCHYDVVAVSSD